MIEISSVDIFLIPLTLREPYTIAYHTVESVTNVGIVLHMRDGLTGVGASGPEEEVTNETFNTVFNSSNSVIKPLLTNSSFASIEEGISNVAKALGDQPAALAMVDMALHDYIAKKHNKPLYSYLGAKRSALPTSITINIHPPEETLKRVLGWVDLGFTMLKIKGGLSVTDDIEKLKLVRSELSHDIPIIFDVNQGYDIKQTLAFADAVSNLNITCIEQPINKIDIQGLCELSAKSPVPIMADESLTDIDTAIRLAEGGVKFFNIKLMKCGGILQSRRYSTIAEKYSVQVIVSCMDECALINAAGLHFALSEPSVTYVDLDSFTDYTVDPTRSAIHFQDGMLHAQKNLGLGFSFISA